MVGAGITYFATNSAHLRPSAGRLVNRVGIPEAEVARLGKEDAIARLNHHRAELGSSRDQAGGPAIDH